MSRKIAKRDIDEQSLSETSIPDSHAKRSGSNSNYTLQDTYDATNSESRFAGLDLDYYKERIPPKQFRLLLEFAGIYRASAHFDPEDISYPQDF